MKKFFVIIYAYSLPLLLVFASVVIYFLIFNIISIDPRIVYSYATDGKFDYNVYFSEEVNSFTDINKTLTVSQDTSPSYTPKSNDRIQEVCKYILDNKVSVIQRIEMNETYIKYLESKQLSTDDLLIYASKLYYLDNISLSISFYLVSLAIIIFLSQKFNLRNYIFFFTGLIYVICTLSYFSNKLSDNTFYYLFFVKSENYNDYIFSMPLLLSSLKEAGLTFIIFDVILQFLNLQFLSNLRNILSRCNILLLQISSASKVKDIFDKEWPSFKNRYLYSIKKIKRKYKQQKNFIKKLDTNSPQKSAIYTLIEEVESIIAEIDFGWAKNTTIKNSKNYISRQNN